MLTLTKNKALSQDRIDLSDAPAIPGLTFRRFRGNEDYEGMAAVIEARRITDRIEHVETAESLARDYSHLRNCDPYQDMLFAEMNGQTISYSRVTWWIEENGDQIYQHFGFLLPAWRRCGIGRAMMRHNERRLRQIAATHETNGRCYFSSFANDSEVGADALLRREGYRPARHFYTMTRPSLENIPDMPLPDGLEIRPILPEHYQAVWDANQEAFKDHWGYSADDSETLEQWLDAPYFDPTLWRVAWDGDEIAGMVLNFIDKPGNETYGRQRGWTEDICVRRPWRRKGLAKALIAQSLQAIKARGMTEAALGVDTENLSGALRLYEAMGYQPVDRSTTYRKEFK